MFSRWLICHVMIVRHEYMGKYYGMNLWKEAMMDLKSQMWFCLKSTPMTVLPWWAADIFTFISSFLSTEILAA
jgi:hypothetical protein